MKKFIFVFLLFIALVTITSSKTDNSVKKKSSIKIKNLPRYHVAYVEYKGDIESNPGIYDVLLGKILEWAVPEGIWDFPKTTKMILVYPDDQNTPKNERRLWFSITVPKGIKTPEGIKKKIIPGGTYAVGSFEIKEEEFGQAWGSVYEWIFKNNYYPDDGVCFEIQKNVSHEHPEQKHIIDICVPVKKKN